MNPSRIANITRPTSETNIRIELNLDGAGASSIQTGLPFLDHMLTAMACHGRIDLAVDCEGDLSVDDHHSVEDCALALGSALDGALADRRGIRRFGSAFAPLDEALARVVIDLSGRPHATVNPGLHREQLGTVATENITHFFQSLATTARCTLHVDVLRGSNDHHKAEAAFKAFALALREAVAPDERQAGIPSTKGTL